MSYALLFRLSYRVRRPAFFVLAGAALLLALLIPAGAAPAEKSAHLLLRQAVQAAPKLPPVPVLLHREGYWHTDRNRILDDAQHEVRIAGVNWSGFETRRGVPGGLTLQDYHDILRTIKIGGYNTVRLPLSNEMIETPQVPQAIGYSSEESEPINGDLEGLNSLQILDRIIAAAGKLGLRVILDDHRSDAGDSAEASGLWYTPDFPEEAWITDWTMLARRYKSNATVIGMDLRNEPHNASTTGACWDCGGDRDWHLAASRAGNAILHVNPKLLIFVEGVDSVDGDNSWWGGNLAGVRRSPVRLAVPNRLVYSAHAYGPAEYKQSWFNPSTSRASLRAIWRRQWAFISEAGLAPVWIGEFGTPNTDDDVRSAEPGSEGQWFSEFVQFLREEHSIQWTYWGINGEDRYGLLDAQYRTAAANPAKAQALASLLPGRLDFPAATPSANAAATAPRPVIPPLAPQPVLPVVPVVPTEGYAEASSRDVRQSLPATLGQSPAATSSAPRPASKAVAPSTKANVNQAVAADVQRAIAAAMRDHPDKIQ